MKIAQLADVHRLKAQVGEELTMLRRVLGAVFVGGFLVCMLVDQFREPDGRPDVAAVAAEAAAPLMLGVYLWRRHALRGRLARAFSAFAAKLPPREQARARQIFGTP